MKGKIFLFLFALPFFGVGVWMAWSVADNVASASQMKSWVAVEAVIERGGYDTRSGDDSDSYEAYAEYRYRFHDIEYRGDRVGLSTGADNIGSFQMRTGNELAAAVRTSRSVTVYVDPSDPASSVIKRDLRWELLGFKSIFLLVFGGVGLGLMIFAIRSSTTSVVKAEQAQTEPWLANSNWQTFSIRSSSRGSMFFAWGFAALWNLISAPIPFLLREEVVDKGNYLAFIGLLFPLVGVGLLVWAVKRTREWRRFGPTPVTLDPFPGSIGGHVGGFIDINAAFDSTAQYTATLSCIHSYMSGSGKERSRNESVQWQDSRAAHVEAAAMGSRLRFRFEVPAGLKPSDAVHEGENYYLWRLNVQGDIPGVDLDRDFEIPVYPTGSSSKNLPEHALQQTMDKQNRLADERLREQLGLTNSVHGNAIRFPAFRNPSPGITGSLIGGIFAGVGVFLLKSGESYFIGGGFVLVGGPIFLFSFLSLIRSLEVQLVGSELEILRRYFGINVRRHRIAVHDIVRLSKESSMQTQSGGKHIRHYSIYAIDRLGKKTRIGEGFRGETEADAGLRVIAQQFSISRPPERAVRTAKADDNNFLAAGN